MHHIEFADADGKMFMRFDMNNEENAKKLRSELCKRMEDRNFSILLNENKIGISPNIEG